MKQISIIIALALLTTIANAQNIKGSHQVRANDEVKKQQVENRSENRPLIYSAVRPDLLRCHLRVRRAVPRDVRPRTLPAQHGLQA